jgi:hypothetical protein
LITLTIAFLRETLGPEGWSRVSTGLSPELQDVMRREIKHAGWYPIAHVSELTRTVARNVGMSENDRARDALFTCGKYVAAEAANTFLKMLLKMLSPGLFVKKLPDIFRRDFSAGRMTAELSGRRIRCRHYDLHGFDHIGVLSAGFMATALQGMGKTVENIEWLDWALDRPYVDGTGFEVTWKE